MNFNLFQAESLSVILLWIALVFIGAHLLYHLPLFLYRQKKSYMLGYKVKRARLRELDSPKLVMVGSSAMAFGTDTEKISRELNIPAVNMGVHSGFGVNFMFNEIEPYLKEGDIVTFCESYYSVFYAAYGIGKHLIELLEISPSSIKYMDFNNLKLIPKGIPGTLTTNWRFYRNIIRGDKPFGKRNLFPDRFNENGDFVIDKNDSFRIDISKQKPLLQYRGRQTFDQGFVEIFEKYRERFKKMGVRLFIIPPAYPSVHFEKHADRIKSISHWLKEISGVPFLGNYDDYIYPPEWFYDNVLHLREEGKPARTAEIIKHLKQTGLFNN